MWLKVHTGLGCGNLLINHKVGLKVLAWFGEDPGLDSWLKWESTAGGHINHTCFPSIPDSQKMQKS